MTSQSEKPPTASSLHKPVQDTAPPQTPPQRERPVQAALRRAWRRLHFSFPRLVPSPYQLEREYLLCRDAKDNLASRVPPEERLRQPAIWGVEIFGPAQSDHLQQAFDRLGWNDDRLFGMNSNPGAWIGEQRTYGSGGCLNLGVIERPGKSRFLLRGRNAPLPDAVDYAYGWIYQLSPSVTAVIICFLLRDSASNAYHSEIDHDRKTVHEPLQDGYRSYNVEYAKHRAVELVRMRMRATVVEWFAAHLPGFFSLAPDGSRLPTVELLTTVNQSLLDTEKNSIEPNWAQLATPRGFHEIWSLKNLDGLKLCWPTFEGELRYHGIANLCTGLLSSEHLKYRGDPGDQVYVSLVDDHIRGVLANFAAIAALHEIIRCLRLAPSSLAADTTSRRSTVRCLEQIRLFFDRSVGIPAITAELLAKSEHAPSYSWNCEAFQATPVRSGEEPVLIAEALRSRTQLLATRAHALEKETREHLEQLSAILSTRENIRTQARMELVTLGAAIVSVASLVVAIMSVDRFATYVNQQVEKIYKSR